MFRHLRTKLTFLYAGLFAVILLVIAGVALTAVSDNARKVVRKELAASGVVFERVWAQRASQFVTDGVVLSRDFGFRSAVATHDEPTIRSALENLKTRLGVNTALMIGADGRVITASEAPEAFDRPTFTALQGDDVGSGVLSLNGAPYEAVSVPIGSGSAMGWLVLAERLDRRQMAELESMAAIPLHAEVETRTEAGQWRDGEKAADAQTGSALSAAINGHGAAPLTLDGAGGPAMALVKPLHALVSARQAALLLRYPLAQAMASYRTLLGLLVAIGALGFAALVFGARALARSVTRPISSLEDAARRLQRGERALVEVQTKDEIGRLAESFNVMASEINQREHDLESARDQAEAANRAKSIFLTNMSHEVRTPLNGVIGLAGVLSGTALDAGQRQMVDVIQSSADVLQRVLDDVLDLARVDAGRMDVLREPFTLGEALEAAAAGPALQCADKGLSFRTEFPQGERRTVAGDRIRLEQILGNLLGNAVKFTEQGSVGFRVQVLDDERVEFVVEDTGIGFDPADAENLFRPFHQIDGSVTRKFGGAGLGLSISRELARAMGGDISAWAAPGRGAVFTLTLPLQTLETGHPAVVEAAETPSHGDEVERALRVLVVDDNETNRTVARLILEGFGAEVVCAEDGEQGVDAFFSGPFDVVFMDMQMPVMDGLTAIRIIRERELAQGRSRSPILMLSANAMPEHVDGALAAGADAHVAKPITPPRLLAAIEQVLSDEDVNARAA